MLSKLKKQQTAPEAAVDLKKKSSEKKTFLKSSKTESFSYEAIALSGEITKGEVKAPSYAEAKRKLEHDGLKVLRIVIKKPWHSLEFGRVVPISVLVQAIRQLSSFAQAGIPISKGLEVLCISTDHKRMRQSLEELRLEIEGGTTFSEALMHQSKIYPAYFASIIASAERTGDIGESLKTINEYLERDLKSSRAVKSALFYPAVLMALAIVAVTMLSVVVLPRFEVFFQSLNVQLPATTRALLWVTHFLGTYWWALITLSVILTALYFWLKSIPKGRIMLDLTKMRLPILGNLMKLVAIERFCRVLSTLTQSQVPLPDALAMAGSATGNKVFERDINIAREAVINGEGLSVPLSRSKVFPKVAVQIFRVGEDSGMLGMQLSQASAFYSDELDFKMKNFTSLIEPIVLLVLGTGIGFVSVALVSAMYGIYNGAQA